MACRIQDASVAYLCHELRNPLVGVIGATDLLQKCQLSIQAQGYADLIRISGENLLHLIDDVLNLVRAGNDPLELFEQEFCLVKLVDEVVALQTIQADAKGIRLVSKVSPFLSGEVHGDSQRLRQVLNNLMGNAIKFTERGSVTLRVKPKKGDGVFFAVCDTGVGIPTKDHSRIFMPFKQAGNSLTEGTGLGLAISQQLVRRMGAGSP